MKNKFSDILTIILCLAFIFGCFAAFIIVPDNKTSDFEGGKLLQGFPEPEYGQTAGDFVIHGSMASQFNEYFCDQFPLRQSFMTLKSLVELAFGRNDNGGVLYTGDRLATIRFDALGYDSPTEFYSAVEVQKNLEHIKKLCESSDIDINVMLPPRNIDVVGESIGYNATAGKELDVMASATLGEHYVPTLDVLKDKHDGGSEVYFRTDHHWTALGAYYAYCEVIKSFGETPYELDSFKLVPVAYDFRGSALTNGNYFFLGGESLSIVRYAGDSDFEVKSYGNDKKTVIWESSGFYGMDKLETSDKYGVFLNGKPMYMTITKKNAERETLLVMKDSFGHSLVPFLARHYNIVVVDIDNASTNLTEMATAFGEELNADKALIVYNMQNVVAFDKLRRFR